MQRRGNPDIVYWRQAMLQTDDKECVMERSYVVKRQPKMDDGDKHTAKRQPRLHVGYKVCSKGKTSKYQSMNQSDICMAQIHKRSMRLT